MPSYTLISLSERGEYSSLLVHSKEMFTQQVHRAPSGPRPGWYTYIPSQSPTEVRLRGKARLLAQALYDVEKEVAHWGRVCDGLRARLEIGVGE